jgi:hypothetical protein
MSEREKHYDIEPDDDDEDDGIGRSEREPFGVVSASGQDDAFQRAMRRAIARGKERAVEGVKTADPNDSRVLRPMRGEPRVTNGSVFSLLV